MSKPGAIDPWSEEVPPPRWFGQQAGCVAALAAGAIGLVLFAVALVLFWMLVRGS